MSLHFPTFKREVLEPCGRECVTSQVFQNSQFWINPPAWTHQSGTQDVYPEDPSIPITDVKHAFYGVIARPMTRLRLSINQNSGNGDLPIPRLQILIVGGSTEGQCSPLYVGSFDLQDPGQTDELVQVSGRSLSFWGVYARTIAGGPSAPRRIQLGMEFHIDNAGANTASSTLFPASPINNTTAFSPPFSPTQSPGMVVAVGPAFVASP